MTQHDTTDGEESLQNDEWTCPACGSKDPHSAITFYEEIEVDVTCENVYIVPIDGGDGFAFSHADFDRIVRHFEEATG